MYLSRGVRPVKRPVRVEKLAAQRKLAFAAPGFAVPRRALETDWFQCTVPEVTHAFAALGPKRLFPRRSSDRPSSSNGFLPLQTGPTEAGRRYPTGLSARIIHGRPCQSHLKRVRYFARVVGELDERGSRSLGRQHKARQKSSRADFAMAPQVDPLRIDAGHPPVSAAAAKQGVRRNSGSPPRDPPFHMPQDPRLSRGKLALPFSP